MSAERPFRVAAALGLATAVLMFGLIVIGSVVRTTGSGLACPDWPLCQGRLIPPLEPHVLIEWLHRLVALVLGLLLAATVAWTVAHPETRARLGGLAGLAVVLYFGQALLGALTVWKLLSPAVVSGHLATGMLLFATLLTFTLLARRESEPARSVPPPRPAGLLGTLAAGTLLAYGQILLGGLVSTNHAGLACPDWPTCNGQWFPPLAGLVGLQAIHRLGAYALTAWMVVVALRTRRAPDAGVRATGAMALGLTLGQVALGRPPGHGGGDPRHAGHGDLPRRFARGARRAARGGPGAMSLVVARPTARRLALAYLELTKPRIVFLVILTGVPALLLASHGLPPASRFWGALLGIALAAASAASFNHYADRDIDGLMRRTARRPLPSGLLPASHALGLGLLLAALSWLVLTAYGTVLAAALAMASIVYYAVVYTVWLKRRTPQNIVIGGGAGASAPLIAWAAMTGRLDGAAVLMAAIVFLWTPPHFWALALYRREDYAHAGIPMLPVTHGEEETRRQILLYALVLVSASLALPLVGMAGPLYGIPAAGLGGAFAFYALRLRLSRRVRHAVHLFRFSILYLFTLFVLLTLDALVRTLGRGVGR